MLKCPKKYCGGILRFIGKKSNLGKSYQCSNCLETFCIRDEDILPNWQELLDKLSEYGLDPRLYNDSITTSSYYIKFELEGMRSLRVGDHNGKAKYGYKWNLRSDIDKSYTDESRGFKQFFYHISDFKKMIEHMIRYKHYVEQK